MEEFLPWDEYSIETIQGVNGKRYVMGVTKKHLVDFSQGHFVEQGHYFPYVGPENKLLIEATNKALDELGINFGAAHTECKIRGKEVKIVEVNPRLAGNKIGSHLISKSTGVCVVEKILDGALGKSIIWAPCLNKGAAIFCLCADKNGTLTEIQLPLTHHPDAFFAHSKSVGACVRVPQDNDDRIAEVIAISETGESAYRRAKTLASEIRLSIAATEEA